MAVYTNEDAGEFRALARDVAASRGERVVERTSALDDDETVICVVPPTGFSVDLLTTLQKRLVDGGPDTGRFGIVTGLTAASARNLYEREASTDAVHGIMSVNEFDDRESWDDDAVVHTRYDSTTDALRDLDERGLESLSGDFSSKSIHTFLGDGVVCGVPTDHDLTDFEPPYPPCAEGGEMNCPLDSDLVRADQLDVQHVFLASCLPSLVPRITKEMPVHVGLNLLENATTLITAYRQIAVTPTQPLLHYNLLRSGYDAGERCYLLLEQSHALELDWLPFVLFGTPDAAVPEPLPQTYDVDVTGDGDALHCTLSDVRANVVDVTLPVDELDHADRLLVRNRTDALADTRLHYTIFEEGDAVRLLVYSWGRIEADSIRLEIVAEEAATAEYDRLLDSLENARRVQRLNVTSGKLRNQIENLDNHLDGFHPSFWDERFEANAYRDTRDELDNVRSHGERIPTTIQDILTDREYSSLLRKYNANVVSSEMWGGDATSYCCGYRVFMKKFEIHPGDTYRIRAMCPGCYCIYDVPVQSDGSYTYPRIEGDLTFERDTTKELTLSFENPLDVPMHAHSFMWLSSLSDAVHGADVFDPDHHETTLEPGEQLRATFAVEPLERLPQNVMPDGNFDNDYTFHGYVVGNNRIYVGSRKTAPLYP